MEGPCSAQVADIERFVDDSARFGERSATGWAQESACPALGHVGLVTQPFMPVGGFVVFCFVLFYLGRASFFQTSKKIGSGS